MAEANMDIDLIEDLVFLKTLMETNDSDADFDDEARSTEDDEDIVNHLYNSDDFEDNYCNSVDDFVVEADGDINSKETNKPTRSRSKFTGGESIIIETNPQRFEEFTRITREQFDTLVSLCSPSLRKISRRKPVTPQQRLYITLHYLGHGHSLTALTSKFGVGLETVRSVVLDTCDALWNVLSKLYLCPPNEEEWKEIAENIFKITGLPNCLGALDGKHFKVNCPPNSTAKYRRNLSPVPCGKYRSRKKLNSIIVFSACDWNYCFTVVDVCDFGIQTTSEGAFTNSHFGTMLKEKALNIPLAESLPGSEILFPYYFIASSAFPLKANIMKPFARVTDTLRESYNQRIINAKRRIEITFGLLTAKWKCLQEPLSFSPVNSKKIILAAVVLHNFNRFFKTESLDVSELLRSPLCSVDVNDLRTKNLSPQSVLTYRNQLCEYLTS